MNFITRNLLIPNRLQKVESTGISRQLYLRSDQPDVITYSPTEKEWVIPQLNTQEGIKYKVNLRMMNIFNLFMTVPREVHFKYYLADDPLSLKDITIKVGDYDGYSLAQFLSTEDGVVKWTYDPKTGKLVTDVEITIADCEDCWEIVGFDPLLKDDSTGTKHQESQIPINLTGVTQIQLYTNLSVNNIPVNGKFTQIPMSVNFSSLLSYTDYQGNQPVIIMNDQIQTIRIKLVDQNGVPLSNYIPGTPGTFEFDHYLPPWEIVVTVEEVYDPNHIKVNNPMQ